MANLNSVTTNFFPVASETYTNNINATIGAGAVTVNVNSASAYTDGDVVVLTVDPGTASQATFTGVKASSPDRFTNCFWTEGNVGVGHSNGAVITDYDSATHYDLVTKGLRQSINQDGSLKTAAVQTAIGISNTPSVGWNVMAQGLAWTSHAGNGEYTGNFTGDVTTVLATGMKLLVPRSAAAPTQCMSFASASSQYATKAAAAGMTFTGNHTTESWLYLNSYTGANQYIINKYDPADNKGWGMRISSEGRMDCFYGSAGSYTVSQSRQMIPLKRWVHVASVFSGLATPTTSSTLYINGYPVQNNYTASAATTLTQSTGELRLGAAGGTPASTYLDGYLAETRLWAVAQTQAQIQANKDISLLGSESNLIGLWQGNGNFNDKTTNANNLTASGGATATVLMNTLLSAYANSTEYLVIIKVGAFSGGLTPVTVQGGQDGHLPNASMGTIQYSNARSPFGFPTDRNKWVYEYYISHDFNYAIGAANTWYAILSAGVAMTGSWKLDVTSNFNPQGTVAAAIEGDFALSTSSTIAPITAMSTGFINRWHSSSSGASTTYHYYNGSSSHSLTAPTPTILQWWCNENGAGGSFSMHLRGDISACGVRLELQFP